MKRFFLLMASMAGLLCLSDTRAQATPTSVDWNYSYSPNPVSAPATPTGGSLQFPSASDAGAVGSSTITLANLALSTSNPGTETLSTTGSLPISGTLTIIDSNGATGSITLSGSLTGYGGTNPSFAAGTVGGTGGFSNIISSALTLSNPTASAGTGWTTTGSGSSLAYVWTDSKTGNSFSIPVADLSITPPGQPSPLSSGSGGTVSTNPTLGSISAYVVVNGSTPGGGGGTGTGTGTGVTSGVPEPSTLVLSCFGLSFAGLASWRKRRRIVKA